MTLKERLAKLERIRLDLEKLDDGFTYDFDEMEEGVQPFIDDENDICTIKTGVQALILCVKLSVESNDLK